LTAVATHAYIANTDRDWFSHFLHRREPPDEVNFWQPSAHGFKTLPRGAPFFFRLGAPDRKIVGYGTFARYEPTKAWLAWDAFGDLNGAAGFDEMARRLLARRKRARISTDARPEEFVVGCIMISQPVFFAPDEWIADYQGWSDRIQGGKTVEILHGDGQRIFSECLARSRSAAELGSGVESTADLLRGDLQRFGAPYLHEPRLGQSTFRVAITNAYGACAVSGEHSLPALEAAHVQPFAAGGQHSLRNGMLLRADIHRLYDKGYVTVTPQYTFQVSGRLFRDFANGREYERYHDHPIHLPRTAADHPDPALLDWHAQEVFRG
jgi:putative restriction endonuclease